MSVNLSGIADANIDQAAAIDDRKMRHRYRKHLAVEAATAITAATYTSHVVVGATGTIRTFKASITGTIATGADRTVDVDLQKSTGAGAFATVLSATIHFTNASTIRALSSAAFSDSSLVAGDILQIVLTVAGAAGNQAKGLACELEVAEAP